MKKALSVWCQNCIKKTRNTTSATSTLHKHLVGSISARDPAQPHRDILPTSTDTLTHYFSLCPRTTGAPVWRLIALTPFDIVYSVSRIDYNLNTLTRVVATPHMIVFK